MNQQYFVEQGQKRWNAFEGLIRLSAANRRSHAELPDFPHLYRGVCRDLALARQRQFDAPLVDYLNGIVLSAHQVFYADARPSWRRISDFLAFDFPRAVRQERGLILLMHLLFYGSAALALALVLWRPEYVYSLLDHGAVRSIESMYDPEAEHFLKRRGFDGDAQMFGFYIFNNISVAFRTFASGILFGVGSLLIVLVNGLNLGAVFGHLINVDSWTTIGTFVIGHGSLELTAIAFSGAAGMRLGWSLISTQGHSRAESLRRAGRRAMPIVYGSAVMLVGAAVVEGFWSGNVYIPVPLKLVMGTLGWLALVIYFFTAGRPPAVRSRARSKMATKTLAKTLARDQHGH